MTNDELRAAVLEIHGPTGQRTMARHLTDLGLVRDQDGARLRKMIAGTNAIPAEVVAEVKRMLAAVRRRRANQTDLEKRLATLRAAAPRASIIYAQILLLLESGPLYQRDIGAELDDDHNSSTVAQAILRLEELGMVSVDRGVSRNQGYTVALVK